MTKPSPPSPRSESKATYRLLLRIVGALCIAVGVVRLLIFHDSNVRLYFVMGLFVIFIPFITSKNPQ
jgi:hypothetical protein